MTNLLCVMARVAARDATTQSWYSCTEQDEPRLLWTRRATSAAIDAFAGNMGVVREEFGPTDAGCSPGAPPDRGLEQGAVVIHRFPRQDCAVPAGVSVVKHP
jgi:hypothetical protein